MDLDTIDIFELLISRFKFLTMKVGLKILFSFFLTQAAYSLNACDCNSVKSIENSFENSSLVVHGRIISKEFITYSETLRTNWSDSLTKWAKDKGQLLDLSTISQNIILVKVHVLRSYKNQTRLDTLTIFTPRNSSNCGFNSFEVGKEYIIFNSPDIFKINEFKNFYNEQVQQINTLWTNQCTSTIEHNQQTLDSLEIITSPIRILEPKTKNCNYYIDSLTNERIYTNVDKKPQFKEGNKDLINFFKSNTYFKPMSNNDADTVYNCQASFNINPNGRISKIRIIKSEVKLFEKELIEFVKKMPPWQPGKCENNFITYEITLNFRFESTKE
jgi:hypothetical protein